MAEAEAIAVANAVQWILWTCGSGGGESFISYLWSSFQSLVDRILIFDILGSMSANGAQGEKSYIVHVSDHWAFGSS